LSAPALVTPGRSVTSLGAIVDPAADIYLNAGNNPNNNNNNFQRHLDPFLITRRRSSDPESARKAKMKQLRRQLSHLKKKMDKLEDDFEEENGFRASQAEKERHSQMKRLLSEQISLKKQLRGCKSEEEWSLSEDSGFSLNENNNLNDSKDLEALKDGVKDLENSLKSQRVLDKRPFEIEEMTNEQLNKEKSDLSEAIQRLEASFGRLESPEEKEIAKSVYDRHRTVKRLVRRSSAVS